MKQAEGAMLEVVGRCNQAGCGVHVDSVGTKVFTTGGFGNGDEQRHNQHTPQFNIAIPRGTPKTSRAVGIIPKMRAYVHTHTHTRITLWVRGCVRVSACCVESPLDFMLLS